MSDTTSQDRAVGCLLAGAVGDALGGAVEFMSWPEFRRRHGGAGIRDFAEAYGRRGAITDDTQMTLFTADGLIRGQIRLVGKGVSNPIVTTYHAYLRWMATQGERSTSPWFPTGELDGHLIRERDLWHRRAPGNTCISALASGRMGTTEEPINDSKGCGGVMRAAPAGLVAPSVAHEAGTQIAAITHGHPEGWASAGVLADLVARLAAGEDLHDALNEIETTADARTAPLTYELLRRAHDLGRRGLPSAAQLEDLGGGWVAEEALAIGVACAVAGLDCPEEALIASVNHSGDSDSTGSICGNILGAALGSSWIPDRLLAELELRDTIEAVARDCHVIATDGVPRDASDPSAHSIDRTWWDRYPGW